MRATSGRRLPLLPPGRARPLSHISPRLGGTMLASCAAATVALSIASTSVTMESLAPPDDPTIHFGLTYLVPPILHGMLLLALIDSRKPGLRRTAWLIGSLFGCYVVGVTVWSWTLQATQPLPGLAVLLAANLLGPGTAAVWSGYRRAGTVRPARSPRRTPTGHRRARVEGEPRR